MENRTLRWSAPRTLNDPYDTQFDVHIDAKSDELKAATLQKLWDAHYGDKPVKVGNELGALIQHFRGSFPKLTRKEFDREFDEAIDEGLSRMKRVLPDVQDEIRAHMAESKLLCLTKSPDNTIMWAHYAENHQGVVLGFKQIPEFDGPWRVARPVEYLPDMPILLDTEFLADMASGQVALSPEPIVNRLVFTKSEEWKYEREWRIWAGSGRKPQEPHEDIPFDKRELDSVIFGCRIPEKDRTEIAELTQRLYPHADILQVEKEEREFRLKIVPFEA